jgi:hypothetical protein
LVLTTNVGLTKLGLGPVVQVIVVAVEADTTHATPSISTVLSLAVDENPVPVSVTTVPPAVVPLVGLIADTVGVLSYLYSTLSTRLTAVVMAPLT